MSFTLWRPGMRITADRLNAGIPAEWQSWTPNFSTTSGQNQSTFGTDSTIDCTYTVAGNTCQFVFRIIFGSTAVINSTAGGGDNWTFSLPVSAAQSSMPLGFAALFTGATSKATSGLAFLHTTDVFQIYIQSASVDAGETGQVDAGSGIVDAHAPFTWAAGDNIDITGFYKIA